MKNEKEIKEKLRTAQAMVKRDNMLPKQDLWKVGFMNALQWVLEEEVG